MPTATDAPTLLAAVSPPAAEGARVDRKGNGRLLGVALATEGEAKGHGFRLGRRALEQVAAQADGAKGRWTHPGLCGDGLGHFLGRWRNGRMSEDGAAALADFHFSRAAHQVRPAGLQVSAAEYLMAQAEADPRSLGVSIVAQFREAGYGAEDAEERDEPEREDRDGDGEQPEMELAGERALLAADFVDEPAANPDGLFPGPAQLAATRALDVLVARAGGADRALGTLIRYAASRGITLRREDAMTEKVEKPEDGAVKQLAAVTARLEAAERALAAREEADRLRAERDAEAFVTRLRAEGVAAQSPIPEADLAYLGILVHRDEDAAKRLGAALVATAKLRGGGGGAAEGETVKLGATNKASEQEHREYMRARLKAAGVADDNPIATAYRGKGA